MLIIFFNGGGLYSDQWFNHPHIEGLKTDLVHKLRSVGEVYMYDPIFYLEPSLIDKFKSGKRTHIFIKKDVYIHQHCHDLYEKVSKISDKYILISHSRGFIFATVFAQIYKDNVCGFINIDGGYSHKKYEEYIKQIKQRVSDAIGIKIDNAMIDITDEILGKLSNSIRSNDKHYDDNIKLLKDIGKLLCFSQHESVDMLKLEVQTIILNNIEHNSEINLDMNDYVVETLKDKIEFNERLKPNKFIESKYFVNKTHFMYIGMEDVIFEIVNNMIRDCSKDLIKHIYLIRHGETDTNKNNISQGSELDLPLNDTGREQADKTGRYLTKHIANGSIIFASPQLRAKETAQIIGKHITIPIKEIKELSEISKGKLSGLDESDPLFVKVIDVQKDFFLKYKDPIDRGSMGSNGFHDFMEKLLRDEDIGFESYESTKHRIEKVLNMIRSSNHEHIIIVSHSGFLELFLKTVLNLADSDIEISVKGNMKNGKNCWISKLDYFFSTNTFKLITAPNTEHMVL